MGVSQGSGQEFTKQLNNNIIARGHSKVLLKDHCRWDVQNCAFSHRVVSLWRKLPASFVNATSVNMFKNR